jgi:hypothetical protein
MYPTLRFLLDHPRRVRRLPVPSLQVWPLTVLLCPQYNPVLCLSISLQSDVVASRHVSDAKRDRLGLLLSPRCKSIILASTCKIVITESVTLSGR